MTELNVTGYATVDVPLGRGAKLGHMTVDITRFTPAIHDYVYTYGLRQIINDAMADKTDDDGKPLPDDQIIAKAQKRLDNMYAGELRARREGGGEPADPVEAEFQRLVWAMLGDGFKASGELKDVPKGTKDRVLAVINQRRTAKGQSEIDRTAACAAVAETPKGKALRKQAERTVRERGDVNLDELF